MSEEKEEEKAKDAGEEHQEESEGELKRGEDKDLVDEEEVKESVEEDVDESEGEFGNDGRTTQDSEEVTARDAKSG